MAPLGGASFYKGLYREIHLKRSLSKTTELISTKFGRKSWWMGIQVCENRGADTYQPRDKETHVYANKVLGVIQCYIWPAPREVSFI